MIRIWNQIGAEQMEWQITSEERSRQSGHRSGIFWLTGLSGAGKSTLATGAEARLFQRGYRTYLLDGDALRRGISSDLGFSREDRTENVRRAAEIAALLADAGLVVLVAMISPFAADRAAARRAGGTNFHEVFVRATLAECERRDPRGLYQRARQGDIPQFTGISSPYEAPASPDLCIDTEDANVETAVKALVSYIDTHVRLSSA